MTTPPTPPQANVPMHIVGAIVLVAVFCYFGFVALDTFGLESQVAPARVVGTSYRAAGQTYVTQIINGRPHVMPQTVPDAFLAELEIDGTLVTAAVDKTVHDRLREGDQVLAVVTRTRLTGRTGVAEVRIGRAGLDQGAGRSR